MMPRIGIDCRLANAFGGLGRYTREMTKGLLMKNGDTEYVLFTTEKNPIWIPDTRNYEVVYAPFSHYSLPEQLKFPRLIREAKVDLFYAPHFNVPFFCPVPYVVTIHDLILHAFPNDASWIKQSLYRVVMRRAVKNARHIIAVSQFTKKELVQEYMFLKEKRISVVGEGVDEAMTEQSPEKVSAVLKKYNLTKPYFLYVGNAKQHKNVDMLIRAFKGMKDSSKELVLITGGKESERLEEGDGVRILKGTNEEELAALYTGALCFVTASLYEGYCLPIAEAESCGCPVIAFKTTAIPEVASPDALLIDPRFEALSHALKNPPKKSEKTYEPERWKNSAEQLRATLLSWIA